VRGRSAREVENIGMRRERTTTVEDYPVVVYVIEHQP